MRHRAATDHTPCQEFRVSASTPLTPAWLVISRLEFSFPEFSIPPRIVRQADTKTDLSPQNIHEVTPQPDTRRAILTG